MLQISENASGEIKEEAVKNTGYERVVPLLDHNMKG